MHSASLPDMQKPVRVFVVLAPSGSVAATNAIKPTPVELSALTKAASGTDRSASDPPRQSSLQPEINSITHHAGRRKEARLTFSLCAAGRVALAPDQVSARVRAILTSTAVVAGALCCVITPFGSAIAASDECSTGSGAVEVGFSPDGSGESLVLRSIASSRRSIRLAAYSFTAVNVVRALIDAKKRGVDVAVVVDHKANITEDRSGKAAAALNLLVNAGIPTRTLWSYPMQHSKYAVIDAVTVQTGSYNYSVSAARYNSENVLVIANHRELARQYLENWQRLYDDGQPYRSAY